MSISKFFNYPNQLDTNLQQNRLYVKSTYITILFYEYTNL